MSTQNAKELFKDYVPEVLEYDPSVDGGRAQKKEYIPPKKRADDTIRKVLSSAKREEIEAMFKNYKPEVLHYDPEVDGSNNDEHLIREEHLAKKAALVEKIRQAKAARKNNQTTFRQNIRTENEQK